MAKSSTLDILTRYRDASDTHGRRLMILLKKQSDMSRDFGLFLKGLSIPAEYADSFAKFAQESGDLLIDIGETLQSMADDTDILAEFFKEEKKEFK